MITHLLRLLAAFRRLFLTAFEAGIKPVQYLSFAALRRLGALYSVVARLLESRRGGPGPPDAKSKKQAEERSSGSFEITKILDGAIVSLDGIHRSSYPIRPPLDRLSTGHIQMQDSNPDGHSAHDGPQHTSPRSFNHSIDSDKFNIDVQTPEASTFQPLESQRFTASRGGSPTLNAGSLGQELQPSLRSRRSLLPRNDDQKPHHPPVVPPDMGYDSLSRWQSQLGRERSLSPATSRLSASSMSVQSGFNGVSRPRPGSSLPDTFGRAHLLHRHAVHWEEEEDPHLNLPIPALDEKRLVPFSPDQTSRYDRRRFISEEIQEIKLPVGVMRFRDHENPPDWVYIIHPEGKPFFFNESKRVLTDVNLFAPGLLKRVNDEIDIIHSYISLHRVNLPRDYDVVLDLEYAGPGEDEMDIVTRYYCADHNNQIIFYLHEFDASQLSVWNEIGGIYSTQHIGLELQAQYWFHLHLYPTTVALAKEMEAELRDTVLNFIGDTMTSLTSTAPYTPEELRGILDLMEPISKNFGKVAPGSLSLVARLMYIFSRQKFLDFYGLPCARVERTVSVYGKETNERTWLIKILSPILWSAPDVHLFTLQHLSPDRITLMSIQEQVYAKMVGEWQDYILFATVLLNANVAFLAIQTVDEGGGRSPAQTLSYISVATSLGSIILGLLLVRQDRLNNVKVIAVGVRNLVKISRGRKAEALAILYTLPYAFLMWSLCFFTVAFACTVFRGTGTITPTLVGVVGVVVLSQVVHVIVTTRQIEPPPISVSEPPYVKTGLGNDDEVLDRVYGPAKKKKVDISKADKPWYTDPVSQLGGMWRKHSAGNQTETQEMVSVVIR